MEKQPSDETPGAPPLQPGEQHNIGFVGQVSVDADGRPIDDRKEWKTPVLIIEDVADVTEGGTGRAPNLATEDKVTTYYHS